MIPTWRRASVGFFAASPASDYKGFAELVMLVILYYGTIFYRMFINAWFTIYYSIPHYTTLD